MQFFKLLPTTLVLAVSMALAGCGSGEPAASEAASDDTAAVSEMDKGADPATDAQKASEPEEMATASEKPTVAKPKDLVRGPGGLVDKCLARVASETGAKVGGVNRMDESEAAIDVYVNVEGAEAPWKCHGYKDGTVDGVMYSGVE